MGEGTEPRACNTCTADLVTIAYRRRPAFRLVREPLKLGMRVLARIYEMDLEGLETGGPRCQGCMRFYKNALKRRSALFRRLNGIVNPIFDRQLERIVTLEELSQAKERARRETFCQDGGAQSSERSRSPPESGH